MNLFLIVISNTILLGIIITSCITHTTVPPSFTPVPSEFPIMLFIDIPGGGNETLLTDVRNKEGEYFYEGD